MRGQVSVVAIASKGAALSGLEHTPAEASSVVGRTRAVDAEASSYHCRKPGDMARKSGGLHAPVLAVPSWAVHAFGYRTADRLSGLFPQCYNVACRITRDAPLERRGSAGSRLAARSGRCPLTRRWTGAADPVGIKWNADWQPPGQLGRSGARRRLLG